jgi:peptidoglycan-N-acetylglucosamine deacetylase
MRYPFPPINTVYDILGSTTKLTEAQMRNIMAGRMRIVKLARNNPGEIFINGSTIEKVAALTFDDGPDSSVTPRVLDILKNNNVKANFFFVGTQIKYFPGVVKRAYNEGHLILNHSLNHPHFTELNAQGIKNQIIYTGEIIRSIIGKRPSLVRPPYGETNERVLAAARETKNKIIIWSTDSMDWVPGIEKLEVIQNVLDNVRPGEIIIMHSGPGQKTVIRALPEIIKGLKARGFSIVDLGTMLGVSAYHT